MADDVIEETGELSRIIDKTKYLNEYIVITSIIRMESSKASIFEMRPSQHFHPLHVEMRP